MGNEFNWVFGGDLGYDPFGMLTVGRSWSVGSEYRYGFNSQEQDDEVYGNGNFNTAEFWGYDSRLGRRWNIDPQYKLVPFESPYSTNHGNPILYKDPKGDFGPLGALIGGAIGAVKEYGTQAVSGIVQGKSIKDALWNDVDWADVAISTAEGAIAGFSGGTSLLVTQGIAGAAKASIDYTNNNGLESWGGIIGDVKDPSAVLKDFISEGIGFGAGKVFENYDINGTITRSLSNRNSNISQVLWAEFAGQLFEAPFEFTAMGIMDGAIQKPKIGSDFEKFGKYLDFKYIPAIQLETITITAKRVTATKVQATNEDEIRGNLERDQKDKLKKAGLD